MDYFCPILNILKIFFFKEPTISLFVVKWGSYRFIEQAMTLTEMEGAYGPMYYQTMSKTLKNEYLVQERLTLNNLTHLTLTLQ